MLNNNYASTAFEIFESPNSVISRADAFAPISCLLSGEAESKGQYLEIAKEIIRRAKKFIRPDIKEINSKHVAIFQSIPSHLSPEEKKKHHKLLSKYFTSDFLNNPDCNLNVKIGNKKYVYDLNSIISQVLLLRNHKRDQTLVMTSNISRNVINNYFDLEIPLIPSEFSNTLNYVVFLTDPKIVMNKVFGLEDLGGEDLGGEDLEEFYNSKKIIYDNFILIFNSAFDNILVQNFMRNKIGYQGHVIRGISTADVFFPKKSFKEITFLELEIAILFVSDKIEELKLDLGDCSLRDWEEEKITELMEWLGFFQNLNIIKLLAVGLHTHKDIQTPEINKHLINISDLRKYPENVVPMHRSVHTEEVIVNESEANGFRVVRMPQGSVHLIGFKIPDNYDPEKKTTVEAKVAYRWVLNRDTGLKERVLRPVKEHQRSSQYRKRIYEEQG